MITIMSFIKDNFDDYIKVLKYLWSVIQKDKLLSGMIRKEQLAVGWEDIIVYKVYSRI